MSMAAVICATAVRIHADDASAFRPPSVPLVTHDPYLSIWSDADKLTDDVTRHWTHEPMTLAGLIRVDGQTMRVIGTQPERVPAMKQTSTNVTATRTVCTFESDAIKLTLTFMSPILPDDLVLLSTPITYVMWEVTSADGKEHEVTALFAAGADLARNDKSQTIVGQTPGEGATVVKLGTEEQAVLARRGDGVRIDWGYACLSGSSEGVKVAVRPDDAIEAFAEMVKPPADDHGSRKPILASTISFGKVSGTSPVSRNVLIGYDDDKSINYMGDELVGFWKRDGTTIEKAFEKAEKNLADVQKRCVAFDEKLTKSLADVGGEKYAAIANLAYRQSFAGAKIVADSSGMPLMFSKENTSNGCIGTVDVFFPQIPLLLLLNPDLAKATATPMLDYASSDRWKHAYAPHDLGTYPQATGQVYGGGEKNDDGQMPVEECGNMLLVVGGIARVDGDAKFADKYWPLLTKWAKYLETNGVDPASQLCTDDFAGHLARNANLSVKAIMGMGAYAMMADMRGEKDVAKHFRDFARESALKWMKLADAGDHYALAFEKPETWSQKYNLVWDDVLDMDIFPKEVKAKELAFYKTKMNDFGLPLDSRKGYTKTDWSIWTATLADDRPTFELFSNAVYKFANETKSRVPFSDWYETGDAKVVGFIARPVIGGVFMPMLKDDKAWLSWAKATKPIAGEWAKMPVPPPPSKTVVVVPNSRETPQQWAYTFDKPGDDWQGKDFDDKSWKTGNGGFGKRGTPGAVMKTEWRTDDIWLRRKITIPDNAAGSEFRLDAHHDEDLEVFIDGKLVARANGFSTGYEVMKLAKNAEPITPGEHVLAVHCHQTGGGQYVDVGLVRVEK